MKILQIALGNQLDIRDALNEYGEVIYWDWTKDKCDVNYAMRSLVNEHKPDLVFMQIQTPGIIHPWMMKELSEKTKIVNWTGDVRTPTPKWFVDIGKNIHLTLFTNLHDVDHCRNLGARAEYLQVGFPDKIFTPTGPVKKDVPEIIFMGNNIGGFPLSNLRLEMVKKLKKRYGRQFQCYGINWGPGHGPINDQHEEASYYRGAKLAINLSHFNYPRYTSDRMLRAMGSGCMVLSHNYARYDDEFTDGLHLRVWSNLSELFELIDRYLEDSVSRKLIADTGSAHLHANHTWRNRINELMKMI